MLNVAAKLYGLVYQVEASLVSDYKNLILNQMTMMSIKLNSSGTKEFRVNFHKKYDSSDIHFGFVTTYDRRVIFTEMS